MARFELDRLFGLALTDARFFRQLQEHPQQAVVGFELTESETSAVFNIVPTIHSIQDLAIQLDLWMTSDVLTANLVAVEEPNVSLGSSIQRHSVSKGTSLDRVHRDSSHSPKQTTLQRTIQDGEQRICLTLKEPLQHG